MTATLEITLDTASYGSEIGARLYPLATPQTKTGSDIVLAQGSVTHRYAASIDVGTYAAGEYRCDVFRSSSSVLGAYLNHGYVTIVDGTICRVLSIDSNAFNLTTSLTSSDITQIAAAVQQVSGGIVAAQDSAKLYIVRGDTWTQQIAGLGNLSGKTVVWALKDKRSDADSAALAFIRQGTGLERLNGAATTAAYGSITIDDSVAGDITLFLKSDATKDIRSGDYYDTVKLLELGADTSGRNGRTIVSDTAVDEISS